MFRRLRIALSLRFFGSSLLKVYRGLLGGLVVLLGLVNGLYGLPRFFINVQDFAGCIIVAEFCLV